MSRRSSQRFITMTFTEPRSFDFTKLSNYIPPEQTLYRPEYNYRNAPSLFWRIRDGFIYSDSCERTEPSEVEIKRVYDESYTDGIHDAIRTVLLMSDLFPECMEADMKTVKEHGATAFFRVSSITTGRGSWDIAYVKNNNLFEL